MSDDGQTAGEVRRKRLQFRAWHRGIKEMDLALGPFADKHLAVLSDSDLDDFERLLSLPDDDLYDWIVGRAAPPPQFDTQLFRRVCEFCKRTHRT